MTAFDPAAWVAEYEALGGRVGIMHRPGKDGEVEEWFGLTYPREEATRGRGFELQLALTPFGCSCRWEAVAAYVSEREASKAPDARKG